MKKIRVVSVRIPRPLPRRHAEPYHCQDHAGKVYMNQASPLGHPGKPMSNEEVEDKVRRLASRRVGRARVDRLIDYVWNLEGRKTSEN